MTGEDAFNRARKAVEEAARDYGYDPAREFFVPDLLERLRKAFKQPAPEPHP